MYKRQASVTSPRFDWFIYLSLQQKQEKEINDIDVQPTALNHQPSIWLVQKFIHEKKKRDN